MIPCAYTSLLPPNGLSVGSAVFAGLTVVSDTQIQRQINHATSYRRARIHAPSARDCKLPTITLLSYCILAVSTLFVNSITAGGRILGTLM